MRERPLFMRYLGAMSRMNESATDEDVFTLALFDVLNDDDDDDAL